MKKITKCLLLFLFLCAPLCGQEAVSLELGNCTKSVVTYESLGNKTKEGGAALFYPASTMRMYAGCRLTGFFVHVSNWKNVETLRVFVARQLDADPLAVREVKPESGGWLYVPLAEPYVPDGGAVYVGYTVKGSSFLSYAKARETNEEWVDRGGGKGWEKYGDIYSAACYAVVEPGPDAPLPACNVRLKDVRFPACAVVGQPVSVQATVSNLGTATVESLALTFHMGGESVVRSVEGLYIPSLESRLLTLGGVTLTEEGEPAFSVAVSAVNGQPDADPTDNGSPAVSLICRKEFTPRKMLLEVFSTENCTACPAGHQLLDRFFEDDSRVVEMGHHAGFYTDGLTVPVSLEYEWFYKPWQLYAPAMMMDRTNFCGNYPGYADAETPVLGLKEELLAPLSEYALSVPAYVSLALDVRPGGHERGLCVRVEGESLLPIPDGTDTRLYVFLTEDSVYSESQAGASGGFYHRHAVRASLTDTWGQPVDARGGFSAEFTADMPDAWNASRMRAVAFVAAYDADDRNACRVYNTEAVPLAPLFATGVRPLPGAGDAVWREGSRLVLPEGFASLTLRTPDGKTVARVASAEPYAASAGTCAQCKSVYSQCGSVCAQCKNAGIRSGVGHIDLRSLPKGIYLVTLQASQTTKTYKITNY